MRWPAVARLDFRRERRGSVQEMQALEHLARVADSDRSLGVIAAAWILLGWAPWAFDFHGPEEAPPPDYHRRGGFLASGWTYQPMSWLRASRGAEGRRRDVLRAEARGLILALPLIEKYDWNARKPEHGRKGEGGLIVPPLDPLVCPDGGACHHRCETMQRCFRVRACAPLSGVYLNDEWPKELTER